MPLRAPPPGPHQGRRGLRHRVSAACAMVRRQSRPRASWLRTCGWPRRTRAGSRTGTTHRMRQQGV